MRPRSEAFSLVSEANASSSDAEVLVGNVEAFTACLSDAYHADNTTWGTITIASKWDGALNELLGLIKSHIWVVIRVGVAIDEGGSGTWQGEVLLPEEASLVNAVDLKALVWVPAWADHASWKPASVLVDDLAHNVSCWLDGREAAQLGGLDIDNVANLLCDCLSVRGCSWPRVKVMFRLVKLQLDAIAYLWQ